MIRASVLLVGMAMRLASAQVCAAAPVTTAALKQAVVTPAAAAPAASAAPYPASATSPADMKRGKLLFIQCRACHDLQPGQPAKIGPNLVGLIGRKAASVAGFSYSAALKNSGIIWDRAQLERWIEKPSAVVSGNAMAFAGVVSATDRAALLNYLEVETKPAK